jgi:predicted MFS family arabinose efflux permease
VGGLGGSGLSYAAPFWITSIAVACLIVWIAFNKQIDTTHSKPTTLNITETLSVFKTIFTNRSLSKTYFINFLIFFSVMGLYRIVPLYIMDQWRPSLHLYALVISFVSAICFLTNLFLLDKISKHFSTQKFLSALLLLGGILVLTVIIPRHFHWIWLTFGLAVIPTVMALPTCTTWLSQKAHDNEQGQVLGNNQALLVLGESSSAAIGGAIAAIFIPLPVAMIGIILLFTAVMTWRTR